MNKRLADLRSTFEKSPSSGFTTGQEVEAGWPPTTFDELSSNNTFQPQPPSPLWPHSVRDFSSRAHVHDTCRFLRDQGKVSFDHQKREIIQYAGVAKIDGWSCLAVGLGREWGA